MLDPAYYHMPTHEINQAIGWLENVKLDCDVKIQRLQSLKKQDVRMRRHRAKFINMAKDFARDDNFLNHEERNQIEIIRQRLGCTYEEARKTHKTAMSMIRRRQAEMRNIRIAKLYDAGFEITKIANDCDISRQTAHSVIKKHKIDPLY